MGLLVDIEFCSIRTKTLIYKASLLGEKKQDFPCLKAGDRDTVV